MGPSQPTPCEVRWNGTPPHREATRPPDRIYGVCHFKGRAGAGRRARAAPIPACAAWPPRGCRAPPRHREAADSRARGIDRGRRAGAVRADREQLGIDVRATDPWRLVRAWWRLVRLAGAGDQAAERLAAALDVLEPGQIGARRRFPGDSQAVERWPPHQGTPGGLRLAANWLFSGILINYGQVRGAPAPDRWRRPAPAAHTKAPGRFPRRAPSSSLCRSIYPVTIAEIPSIPASTMMRIRFRSQRLMCPSLRPCWSATHRSPAWCRRCQPHTARRRASSWRAQVARTPAPPTRRKPPGCCRHRLPS